MKLPSNKEERATTCLGKINIWMSLPPRNLVPCLTTNFVIILPKERILSLQLQHFFHESSIDRAFILLILKYNIQNSTQKT